MRGYLLDTNILLMLDRADTRLSKKAVGIIDKAVQEGKIYISAFSFWEVGILIAKKRLQLADGLDQWRRKWLDVDMTELSINYEVMQAALMHYPSHKDPADCLIIGTALSQGLTLITTDEDILNLKGKCQVYDARK